MFPTRPQPTKADQRGAVLLLMLIIVVLGVTAALVGSLSTTALKNARQEKTAAALAQAKEALIGYAITYGDNHPVDLTKPREPHGYLPCPDPNGTAGGSNPEGSSETCGDAETNTLGRLPWRTLGLPITRDGTGECLWYAVSGTYKNNPKTASTMNWDNTGKLKVYSADGNEISPDEIIAVVIAPGPVSTTNNPVQDRSGTSAPICGGNYNPAAYLDNDTLHNINNANITTEKFILPHEHRDANGNVTVSVNDQFVYITRQDIWTAIQRRVANEAKKCLDDYAATPVDTPGNKYPWAVSASASTVTSPLFGDEGGYNTTLFGRLPIRPNVQADRTPEVITTMPSKFDELWAALATFASNKTSANLLTMKNKASAAKKAAGDVKNDYKDTPLEDPADDLKDAADDAKDDLTTSSSAAKIASIQKSIVDAANAFTTAMKLEFPPDSSMANDWPASCKLLSSQQWEHWKDLVFYQVADGFRPGSSAKCDSSCLSVEGSAHNAAGSGNYHAVVIIAGKKLTPNRSTSNVGEYLEPDNLLPNADSAKPYQTYRITDAAYQTVNDLVLCLDGKVNCQ
ncbi:MAG TPA: hypothetical protein VMW07_03020 [Gallionella sp.]|nr:hypothetical protein [Gallionella sp.]